MTKTDGTPLIIDSFAGGGGASTGIERALGRSPDVAINHNPAALALHQANHPDTLHLINDIWDVKPEDVAQGQHVGLLWASPDCKHFSKAKGGAPRDRNTRDLAWVVVDWAERVKPDVILMENVEEFKTWGPIGEDGQPIKELSGVTFDLWVKRLRKAGYKIQWRELRACDYGAPTIRRRFFMVARRDSRPIVWPKPTHGDPKTKEVKRGILEPWRTAAECIDWSLPCPSVFETSAQIKEKHGLRAIRPLAKNTMARVARGLHRYVLNSDRPFLVNTTHGGRLEAADEPIRTITGARRDTQTETPHPTILAGGGHSAIAAPVLTYAQQGGHNRKIIDPHHTICASKKDQNAIITPMLAGTMIHVGNGERKGQTARCMDIDTPLNTVVASGVKQYPVAAYLAQHNTIRHGVNPGRAINTPISTLTATGSHQNLIAPWFAKYYGTGASARTDEPCHTVTVKDRFSHVQAHMSAPAFGPEHETKARQVADLLREHGFWDDREFVTLTIEGDEFVIVDIGMRMLTPRELFTAQGFPRDYVIEGVWTEEGDNWSFKTFPKDVQVSCCGNSVCPDLAEALVTANCGHLADQQSLEGRA